jgi:hypothetical protein
MMNTFLYKKTLIFLCFVMLSVFNVLWAATGAPGLVDARQAYYAAKADTKNLEAAVQIVDAFQKDNAMNPMGNIYKGSLRALQARQSVIPWRKMSYIAEGFSLLDKGAEQLSDAGTKTSPDILLEALIISGITNASVPRSYDRDGRARQELEAVIRIPAFQILPKPTQASVYAWLGVLYRSEQTAQSSRYFELACNLDVQVANEIGKKP